MKILQVAPYYYPYIGGQERYVRSLARALAARGHEVKVLTSNFPKSKNREVMDGIEVRRFKPLCKPLNNPISPALFFHIVRECKGFDVIHCHNEHAALSLYSAWAKSRLKIPLIITCHGQLRFDHPIKDLFERVYSKTIGSMLLKRADKVIVISQSDKKYICSLGVPVENIEVIPNGIDPSYFNDNMRSNVNEELNFKGKKVILFVGPLIKRKGPQVLVQAIPFVVKEYSNLLFVFVGTGNFKREVEKLSKLLHVENYTKFLGYVPKEKLYSLYKRCEILVLPSFSEALSYTILDAFMFSKPVISTQIPCISDYLSETAILTPPGDYKSLAKAILQLLDEPNMAKEYGRKGRELIETSLRWDLVVDRIEAVYTDVLRK